MNQFDQLSLWDKYVVGPLIKYFYHRVNYVVNQSNGMHKDLINIYPQLRDRSSVIFNPIPAHLIEYAKRRNQTRPLLMLAF